MLDTLLIFSRPFRLPVRWCALIGALLLAGSTAPPIHAQSASGRLVASPDAPMAGQEIAVDVLVEDVDNVAAFQATLTWDPSELSFVEGMLGEFLETSERDVTFVPPFGEPGRLTFAAYSSSETARPGASGSGVLFGLRLRTRRAGAAEITVEELLLADTSNAPIPLSVESPLVVDVQQPPTVYLPLTLANAKLP